MRLIDADALVDDGLRFQDGYDYDGIMMVRLGDVTKSIRNAPTIDAVPVVRCKDCRWGRETCGNIGCFAGRYEPIEYHGYDWYCPKGERREQDG